MNVRVAVRAIATGLALLCVSRFAPEGNAGSPGETRWLSRLCSPKAAERAAAYVQLGLRRKNTIDFLLHLAGSQNQQPHIRDAREYAVKLLAEYRAVEACELLVNQVESLPSSNVIEEDHPLMYYSAADALVRIGDPSIAAIIDRLAWPVSDKELKIFVYVIRAIGGEELGEELGLYRLRLELAHMSPGLTRKRENLRRLIEMYEATDFTDPTQWPKPEIRQR